MRGKRLHVNSRTLSRFFQIPLTSPTPTLFQSCIGLPLDHVFSTVPNNFSQLLDNRRCFCSRYSSVMSTCSDSSLEAEGSASGAFHTTTLPEKSPGSHGSTKVSTTAQKAIALEKLRFEIQARMRKIADCKEATTRLR